MIPPCGTLNDNGYRQAELLELGNDPVEVRRFVRREAFSYMLGLGSVLPTLEYAFAPILSDAGIAWARGETAHLP